MVCDLIWIIFAYRDLLRHSARRLGWLRRSNRTDLCQTGLGTRLTTRSGTTLRGETGGEQSWSSEQVVGWSHSDQYFTTLCDKLGQEEHNYLLFPETIILW